LGADQPYSVAGVYPYEDISLPLALVKCFKASLDFNTPNLFSYTKGLVKRKDIKSPSKGASKLLNQLPSRMLGFLSQ
jgi:hypothetical protein